jgi:hypothetical protein
LANLVFDSRSFKVGGNFSPVEQSVTYRTGPTALMFHINNNSQTSFAKITVTGPGILTFWWTCWIDSSYSYFQLWVDGVLKVEESGTYWKDGLVRPWTMRTVDDISEGQHTIQWCLKGNQSYVDDDYYGYLDDVVFTSTTPL